MNSQIKKIIISLSFRNFLKFIPDELYLKMIFPCWVGQKLNLKKPQTYNEKLQWLKLYDRKPQYCKYVDKYAVRSHIREIIGDQYLIPLIGVYDTIEEIDWSSLPNKFVLKCTHGSGSNIICTNKEKLDIETSKKKLKKWMKKNWYWFGREWPYKNVKPRIVCEEFISDKDTTPDDYKVLCFNGKAKLIGVHIDRYGNYCRDIYDREWNKTTIVKHVPMSNFVYEKPKQFENMIQLSEKLASDISHVRIDWFIIEDKLYFGEITLYESSGFDDFDKEYDYLMGSWIKLPIEKDDKK